MPNKRVFTGEQLRYLSLLSQQYPTVQAASTEIIRLQSILNLPKGTEHFMSDLHGEYEAFLHILNSCSGVVREKVDELFSTSVSKAERDQLATLIYYPEEKLEELKASIVLDSDRKCAERGHGNGKPKISFDNTKTGTACCMEDNVCTIGDHSGCIGLALSRISKRVCIGHLNLCILVCI